MSATAYSLTQARRYTVETLAAGQPRPYADTIRHVRVTFEHVSWDKPSGGLQPNFTSEEAVRRCLPGLLCGFTEKTRADVEWFETRLDWLKPIDGKPASEVIHGGDPKQICASVWEFHTTTPFTD